MGKQVGEKPAKKNLTDCRFYNWCLTQWKPENIENDTWCGYYLLADEFYIPHSKLMYAIWGLEQCPDTDKLHIHYYVEFTEKVSMKWIKEQFNDNTLHCEPRKGTQQQAIDYVTKKETKVYEDDDFFYYGEKKKQGNRTDLDSMVDMIEEGYYAGDILRIFRGNGLRHIHCIYRGIQAIRRWDSIDMTMQLYQDDPIRDLPELPDNFK